ncbi:MAG TPA: tetratricopeptide repeat protein [Pyrinomonadaceae bacterium]|nr:tetratricopeptide repeat protein [Pyrinomonadaceae bacterium]
MRIFIALVLTLLCALPGGGVSASPQTRDTWRSVRTNNLFVIGNADAEKLRQVATWLEFFHGAFGRMVSRSVIDSSVPTTVILFRDEASFQTFKPLYQGRPANVAGYFQPGDDVNYIAISLDLSDGNPFSTAFHEYVHAHVNENIPGAPLWLNEGLAEFYGSLQFSSGEAVLGTPLMHYIRYLRQEGLLPLTTLFSISTSSEHYNESEKTGVFYGQSWALVHYLMLGGHGRQDQFKRFLSLIARGDSSAKAIEDVYGVTLPALEQELSAYIRGGNFPTQRIASMDNPQAYAAYTAMQRTSLSEGEANYYLGDLLLHTGRPNDAERYFKHAVMLDPGFMPAHAALGQLYVQQRRYPDAKKYLEKAASSSQDYMTHYLYAYVLSREGVSPNGRINEYSPATAALMREHLLRAIKLSPNYAAAYYYLGLVNLVTGERLDEALEMAQRAKQLEPSQTASSLLLAQIYIRRSDHAAARRILEPLTSNSDKYLRDEAQRLLESMDDTSGSTRTESASSVSSAMISEPVQPSTGRVFGGESGGVAINDGRTIERSGSLPTVDEVLSKYVEALGGSAAINAVTSRVMKGSVDIAGISRGGTFENYAQAPNKMLEAMDAYPMGAVKIGYNGRSGWARSKDGLRVLKGKDLIWLQRDADFYALHMVNKNRYEKVTLAGTSKIGYRDVYVLDLQLAAGAVDRVYLDTKTYLPARLNTVLTLGNASGAVEVYFDDWRAVDGIKFPFSISQRSLKLTMSITIKEIKHNVPIDPKIFDPIP